jgi:hypothetical protein
MTEQSTGLVSSGSTTELPPEMLPSTCAHYWLIETPAGESSQARCKSCGATRAFLNYSQRRTMTRSVKPTAPTASASPANGTAIGVTGAAIR